MLIGENIENTRLALGLAHSDPFWKVVAGVHPHKALEWNENVARELENDLAADSAVIAIGEIGLDYHYDFAPREVQRRAFIEQFAIADRTRKPIVIHCREAYDELLDLTTEHLGDRRLGPAELGIMHCYFGTLEQARRYIELGFVLGIGGACTFKNAHELHAIIREIPLEHLVLETDAPYMAPIPYRGKRNESSYVPIIAARIAELKNITIEEVAAATTATARRVYRLN